MSISSIFSLIAPVVSHAAAPPLHAAVIAADPYRINAIPQDGLTLVVDEEDGSPTYYAKNYEGWDWPAGASGPTIAIGYDCGYVTAAELEADWKDIVSPAVVQLLLKGVGLRGEAAEVFVHAHRHDINITWDQAIQEFVTREEPKWLARCRAALPNFDAQFPLCQAAIFSLSYNRGTGGYGDPSSRDAEMRAIKHDIETGNFKDVPNQISAMRRLWPKGGDLWNRRLHEAALYQKGLDNPPVAMPTALAA